MIDAVDETAHLDRMSRAIFESKKVEKLTRIKSGRRRCPPTSAHGLGAPESWRLQLALVSH